jgi:hypothetical protein
MKMGELTIQWPDEGVERMRAARGRLETARHVLTDRTPDDVREVLGAWLDGWREACSPWRTRLTNELAEAAGFAPATVEAGLELGLADWTGTALHRLAEQEIDPQLGRDRARLAPFEWIGVVGAGSIPMPALLQCVAPLLVGSPVLVKPGARDPVTARLAVASLAERDAELARCIEVVSCDSSDEPAMAALFAAPCLVASGSDETIERVRARLTARQRLVAYGHKLSVAIVGDPGEELATLAGALARDVALWDQQGCLSPVALFVMAADARGAAERIGEALASALGELASALPRGAMGTREAATAAAERSGAEMRRAAGEHVTLLGSAGQGFDVVVESNAEWRPAPLGRFLRIHPVADEAALFDALAPIAPHLSSAAVSGIAGTRGDALVARLHALGASRICAPGHMQAPPLDWHHDGLPVLTPLARFADLG